MNEYEPPKSDVALANQPKRVESALSIVLKASIIGSSFPNLFGGLLVLLIDPDMLDSDVLIGFVVLYFLTTIVAFAVTLVYGIAIEYVLIKLKFVHTMAYVIAGAIPSVVLVFYGAIFDKQVAYWAAMIIGIYSTPISVIGGHYSYKKRTALTSV